MRSADRLDRWRSWTDLPLMVLAIGSLPVLLLEIERGDLPRSDRLFIDAVNVTVLVAFAVDYFVELFLAPDRSVYVRREWSSAAIVVAQAVALVPVLSALGVLRAVRGARLFRVVAVVLRGLALGGSARSTGRQLVRRHPAGIAFGVAGLTWLTSAASFTLAEDVGVNGRIHSFGDALWWSACTITTVGYGDVFPVTAAGRLVGMFTMVVGVSVFALVTASIAKFLVRSPELGENEGSLQSGDQPINL